MGAPDKIEPHDLPGLYLQEIDQSGALPEGVTAEDAAASVLCTLVQEIKRETMDQVIDSAPAGLLPFFKTCPLHRHHGEEPFEKKEFIERIGDHLPHGREGVEDMLRTVLQITRRWLQPREADLISGDLPPGLAAVWNEEQPESASRSA